MRQGAEPTLLGWRRLLSLLSGRGRRRGRRGRRRQRPSRRGGRRGGGGGRRRGSASLESIDLGAQFRYLLLHCSLLGLRCTRHKEELSEIRCGGGRGVRDLHLAGQRDGRKFAILHNFYFRRALSALAPWHVPP